MIGRRSFLLGLGAAVCAPAIIRPGILMPVKKVLMPEAGDGAALYAMPHPVGPWGNEVADDLTEESLVQIWREIVDSRMFMSYPRFYIEPTALPRRT